MTVETRLGLIPLRVAKEGKKVETSLLETCVMELDKMVETKNDS